MLPSSAKSPAVAAKRVRSPSPLSQAAEPTPPGATRAKRTRKASHSPARLSPRLAHVSGDATDVSVANADAPAAAAVEEMYDRQVRLWGAEAQARVRAARVALVGGAARLLAAEIAKNLALAGIGRLTLIDKSRSASSGQPAFFNHGNGNAAAVDVVAAGVRNLNPMVHVEVRTDVGVAMLSDSGAAEDAVKEQDLIILCDAPSSVAMAVNDATRALNVPLIVANVYGVNAVVFTDLLTMKFIQYCIFACCRVRNLNSALRLYDVRVEHRFDRLTDPRNADYFIRICRETTEPAKEKDGDPTVVRTARVLQYVHLRDALKHRFAADKKLSAKARTRVVQPSLLALAALQAFERAHNRLPAFTAVDDKDEVKDKFGGGERGDWEAVLGIAEELADEHGVPDVLRGVQPHTLRNLLRAPQVEFAASAAVAGGLAAQEALKALQRKHRPLANLAVYAPDEGGAASVYALGITKGEAAGPNTSSNAKGAAVASTSESSAAASASSKAGAGELMEAIELPDDDE